MTMRRTFSTGIPDPLSPQWAVVVNYDSRFAAPKLLHIRTGLTQPEARRFVTAHILWFEFRPVLIHYIRADGR